MLDSYSYEPATLARAPLDLVRGQGLIDGLDEMEAETLLGAFRPATYLPGETILDEGQRSRSLFLIEDGTVEVLKRASDGEAASVIAELGAGDFVGEMSYLDDEPTSAAVRARSACTLWVLSRDALRRDRAAEARVSRELDASLSRRVLDRFRRTNQAYAASLRAQLEESRLRNDFGRFFIVVISLFGTINLAARPLNADLPPMQYMLVSWGVLILLLVPVAIFARRQSAPPETFGLTPRGWKRSAIEGVLFGAGMVTAGALLKLRMQPEEVLFSWANLREFTRPEAVVFLSLYLPHSFLQELIARGVVQGSLQRFLGGTPRLTVILTSVLFGIFHIHVSYLFALLTGLGSLFFGFIYARHRSLVGVTLAHFVGGLGSIALGFL